MSEIKILLLLLFLLLQITVSSGEFSSAAQSRPRGADSVDLFGLSWEEIRTISLKIQTCDSFMWGFIQLVHFGIVYIKNNSLFISNVLFDNKKKKQL